MIQNGLQKHTTPRIVDGGREVEDLHRPSKLDPMDDGSKGGSWEGSHLGN